MHTHHLRLLRQRPEGHTAAASSSSERVENTENVLPIPHKYRSPTQVLLLLLEM